MRTPEDQKQTRRKLLARLVALGFLVVIITMIWALSSSLTPNAKARAKVRTFPINEVPIGTLKSFHEGDFAFIAARKSEFEFAIFEANLIRNGADQIYFIFPGRFECKNISMKDQNIVCSGLHDPSLEWQFDGTPIEGSWSWVSKLPLLPYAISGDVVRYGKGA